MQSLNPCLLVVVCGGVALAVELHYGVMSVGMTAAAAKHAPVGITANIAGFPVRLVGIVQPLRNLLVAGLGIKYRLDGIICPGRVYIHPVVFFGILWYGVILVTHALVVTTMSALECVEVNPLSLAPPLGRCVASAWVIGHKVVLVYLLYACSQSFPNLGFYVALNVAPHEPHYVRTILIAVSQESSVSLCLFYA